MLNKTGILIVGHGSPRAKANEGFMAMAGRIALRLGSTEVLPAFFSIAKPSIEEQVAALVSHGVNRIVILPYFLYAGQHVSKDIPPLLDECRTRYPDVTIEFLPTLENEPALEEIVVDRLVPFFGNSQPLPVDGKSIERRSFQIIDNQLVGRVADADAHAIVRRIIHATADFSFSRTLRIHPQAIQRGIEAIQAAKPIICDVKMLQAGITRTRSQVLCGISDEDVKQIAKVKGCTRAAAAIQKYADQLDGSIVAVGNAPTALWQLLEIVSRGGPRPALVVGLPVGFVGARESKQALMESNLCYISNVGNRGGSPVAASAINALAALAEERGTHA